MAASARLKKSFDRLRGFALRYPLATEEFPWGESAFKVRGKSFAFAVLREDRLHVTAKLSRLREFALEYPFTKPTAYGARAAG